MSNNSVAETLVLSAIKTVGKREFLKTVDRLFAKSKDLSKGSVKEAKAIEVQCKARVKGARTGIKLGRHVLFDAMQCPREVSKDGLCCIHNNRLEKFGGLSFGLYSEPLTEEQSKVFGES